MTIFTTCVPSAKSSWWGRHSRRKVRGGWDIKGGGRTGSLVKIAGFWGNPVGKGGEEQDVLEAEAPSGLTFAPTIPAWSGRPPTGTASTCRSRTRVLALVPQNKGRTSCGPGPCHKCLLVHYTDSALGGSCHDFGFPLPAFARGRLSQVPGAKVKTETVFSQLTAQT